MVMAIWVYYIMIRDTEMGLCLVCVLEKLRTLKKTGILAWGVNDMIDWCSSLHFISAALEESIGLAFRLLFTCSCHRTTSCHHWGRCTSRIQRPSCSTCFHYHYCSNSYHSSWNLYKQEKRTRVRKTMKNAQHKEEIEYGVQHATSRQMIWLTMVGASLARVCASGRVVVVSLAVRSARHGQMEVLVWVLWYLLCPFTNVVFAELWADLLRAFFHSRILISIWIFWHTPCFIPAESVLVVRRFLRRWWRRTISNKVASSFRRYIICGAECAKIELSSNTFKKEGKIHARK